MIKSYESRKDDGFVTKVQLDSYPGMGCGPRAIVATTYHESCTDVILGMAETPQIQLRRETEKSPAVLYVYHTNKSLFDRGIEKIIGKCVTVRLEELKRQVENSALEIAKANMDRLCKGR